jgi:hypothetical protein
MSRKPSISGPADDFATVDLLRRKTTGPTAYSVSPKEGLRLVKAFLRISSPERRQAVLKYVADMATLDEAERTQERCSPTQC